MYSVPTSPAIHSKRTDKIGKKTKPLIASATRFEYLVTLCFLETETGLKH